MHAVYIIYTGEIGTMYVQFSRKVIVYLLRTFFRRTFYIGTITVSGGINFLKSSVFRPHDISILFCERRAVVWNN